MIGPVGVLGGRSVGSIALVAACTVSLTGCGGSGSSVTRTAALAFAHAVNLRVSDVPGAQVLPKEPGSHSSTKELFDPFKCVGAGELPSSPVAFDASPAFAAHAALVASGVVVERSDVAAAAELAPFASARGRACLIRSMGASVTSEGATTQTSVAVSGTSVPVPAALGPGAGAIQVLAEPPHEDTSKELRVRVQRFLRHLEHTPGDKRKAEKDRRALEQHPTEKAPPFHVGFAMFRLGPADIILFSIGHAISPALERRLLLLLHSRAVAHKL
jgi:hypothetical protein